MCSSILPSDFTFEKWVASNYEGADDEDHSGRIVCLLDFTSCLYRLLDGIAGLFERVVKVISGALLTLILLPTKPIAIATKTWENTKALGNELLIFFKETLPKNLYRGVGNAIGIFIPEVGRFVRSGSYEILAPLPEELYEKWYTSTYEEDGEDHTRRILSLMDLGSQLYRISENIGKLTWGIIKSMGALIVAVYMVPVTLVTFCFRSDHVIVWRHLHSRVFSYMATSLFYDLPGDIVTFLFWNIPKYLLKMSGNLLGIFVPEMGRAVRTTSFLKTPREADIVKDDPALRGAAKLLTTGIANS